jgi:hypothetical protein
LPTLGSVNPPTTVAARWGPLIALAAVLLACSSKKPSASTSDSAASSASAASRHPYELSMDGGGLDDAMVGYRKATGRDLSISDDMRKRTRCLAFTMALAEDTADDFDAAFVHQLGDKGLRVSDRGGIRLVTRDFKSPAPCPDTTDAPPGSGGPAPDRQADLDSIDRVSDDHFRIERHVLERVVHNEAELMRGARLVPEPHDGKTRGTRLFGVRPDSLFARVGLASGDQVKRVNGIDMTSAENALKVYATLRSATALKIELERKNQPMTITIDIVPDGTLTNGGTPAGSAAHP